MIDPYVKLAEELISRNIIKNDEKSIYIYGLRNLMVLFVNVITVIFIGAFSGKLIETFILMSTFIPLRSYSGGLHLKRKTDCYFASNLIVTLIVCFGSVMNSLYLWILSAATVIFLCFSAPIDCSNRHYDECERTHFNHKVKRILLIEIVMGAVWSGLGYKIISNYIFLGVILVGVLGLLGKLIELY